MGMKGCLELSIYCRVRPRLYIFEWVYGGLDPGPHLLACWSVCRLCSGALALSDPYDTFCKATTRCRGDLRGDSHTARHSGPRARSNTPLSSRVDMVLACRALRNRAYM